MRSDKFIRIDGSHRIASNRMGACPLSELEFVRIFIDFPQFAVLCIDFLLFPFVFSLPPLPLIDFQWLIASIFHIKRIWSSLCVWVYVRPMLGKLIFSITMFTVRIFYESFGILSRFLCAVIWFLHRTFSTNLCCGNFWLGKL